MGAAKLYEAAALARRTLVVAEPGTAAWQEAHRLGLFTLHADDTSAIDEFLTDTWSGREIRGVAPRTVALFYSETAARVAAILRGEES